MNSWERNVRRVTPYIPGKQPKIPGIIKLNTNENPYPPSPKVGEMLRQLAAPEEREYSQDFKSLRQYPDPNMKQLVCAIAKEYELSENQVFAGVGSDDVLSMAFLTFFHGKEPVLFPDITYSFYDVWAEVYGIPYRQIPLNADFRIVKEDYYRKNGGIIFPNPNAPTGVLESLEDIEDILRHNPDSVVIIDEAYIDFGGKSVRPLIEHYENLLVVQTFSKSRSLAGLRIGYAMGSEKLITYLYHVRNSVNSYTMNTLTLQIGACVLKDRAYFQETCAKVIQTREETKQELRALGFEFPDSQANFIFARHPGYDAAKLFEELKSQRIYVRYFNRPRIDQYLRITVGTPEQMHILLKYLRETMP